jgi:hypothetical protein
MVRPAPLAEPALKSPLLPPVKDQTPGNAATVYLMAFPDGAQVDFDLVEKYLTLPMKEFPRKQAREYVTRFKDALRHMDVAGRRSYCLWQDPIREEGGYQTTLWYWKNGRLLGRVLALRARLEIADRRFDAALYTLQTGFALARNYSQGVGFSPTCGATDPDGILKPLLDRVREWVQAEGSPNLYWALANLPRPMVDRRHALEVVDAATYWTFPELRSADRLTGEQAQCVLERIWHILAEKREGHEARQASKEAISRLLQKARRHLIDSGRTREVAEAMPASTAVLVYLVDEYRTAVDDVYKWAGVPYWQGIEGLDRSMRRFVGLRKRAPDNPLLRTMVRVDNQFLDYAIRDREAALLQCVEGLRAYAATHDGQLPKSLDDLAPDTPAPPDPVLGKSFAYRVRGNTALLQAASPPLAFRDCKRAYQVVLDEHRRP